MSHPSTLSHPPPTPAPTRPRTLTLSAVEAKGAAKSAPRASRPPSWSKPAWTLALPRAAEVTAYTALRSSSSGAASLPGWCCPRPAPTAASPSAKAPTSLARALAPPPRPLSTLSNDHSWNSASFFTALPTAQAARQRTSLCVWLWRARTHTLVGALTHTRGRTQA
jgi:hypothetical protein